MRSLSHEVRIFRSRSRCFGVECVGIRGSAAAVPSGVGSAADTVKSLEADGYTVQVNGAANGPLSECAVTGVHPGTTVYVDIACPST